MPHPSELDNLPLYRLVELANDEIRRLCCGPRHAEGRAWTMCIPAQASDSDLVLHTAVNRQAKAIAELEQQTYSLRQQLGEMTAERDRLKESDVRIRKYLDDILAMLKKHGIECAAWGIDQCVEKMAVALAKAKV